MTFKQLKAMNDELRDELAEAYCEENYLPVYGCSEEGPHGDYYDAYKAGFDKATELAQERERVLVEALEFYRDGKHWSLRPMIGDTICDHGEVAKMALAKVKGG